MSTQDGSDDQENVDFSLPSPDISDPRIFMITKAISPFSLLLKVWGLLLGICRRIYTGLPLLPHQNMPFGPMMEIHHRALSRAGVVDSPPKHADSLAGGSPAPSTASEGGGPMGVVERGDMDDVLSLHPNDMLQPLIPTPQQPVNNKFCQYQTNITKTAECLASPLPVDIAACFNSTYYAPLQESQEVKPSFLTLLDRRTST